jgi:hypothetical protein
MSRSRYPWEQALIDALLVAKDDRHQEKIALAEQIIRSRSAELAGLERDGQQQESVLEEFLALQDALRTIKSLKRLYAERDSGA